MMLIDGNPAWYLVWIKIIESARVGCRKPGEEIYNLMLEKLDINPGEAVFIDDMGRNVETAKSLGWQGIEVLIFTLNKWCFVVWMNDNIIKVSSLIAKPKDFTNRGHTFSVISAIHT